LVPASPGWGNERWWALPSALKEVINMTVAAKMKGQLKETTGMLTGDTGMEVEGKFEQGVAEVKRVVGGAVDYVTEVVGNGINTVTNAITDLYKSTKRTISKLF
jgi:uncharacterized protein YjbJ (UPF0337 family)